MGFTCILLTNIVLDGRYWDFKPRIANICVYFTSNENLLSLLLLLSTFVPPLFKDKCQFSVICILSSTMQSTGTNL